MEINNNVNLVPTNTDKPNRVNLTLAYMLNPDKIFYDEMDYKIIHKFEELGCTIVSFEIQDIHFKMSQTNGTEIFIKNKIIKFDGFLSYGYMSKFNFDAYFYILNAFHILNIPTSYNPEDQRIMNSKLLQSFCFTRNNIPIPDTHAAFAKTKFKEIIPDAYPKGGILKTLDDYGGSGVTNEITANNLIDSATKILWRNEYTLFQKFITDSIGKSIRVLCINSKAVGCVQFTDKTHNFRSNISYGFENFSLDSMMESEKFAEYAKLGEAAVKSIGNNILAAGVDILDSKEYGLLVLEVNCWPDLIDTGDSVGKDFLKLFASTFIEKCLCKN